MTTEAKPASPQYTVGQRVEVLAFDTETPGLPYVWMPGTITAVDQMDSGRWKVAVDRDNGLPWWLMVTGHGSTHRIQAL